MKAVLVGFIFGVFLVSCSVSKPAKGYHKNASAGKLKENRTLKSNLVNKKSDRKVSKVISDAERYLGAPYKLGGMTSSGFDCSGFIVKVFNENSLSIARRSEEQSKEGIEVKIQNVKEGDLLFFATAGGKRVSHVGIVHTIKRDGEIRFIHASTTRGVIISSLNENYWNRAFLFARRVL